MTLLLVELGERISDLIAAHQVGAGAAEMLLRLNQRWEFVVCEGARQSHGDDDRETCADGEHGAELHVNQKVVETIHPSPLYSCFSMIGRLVDDPV